MTLPAYLTSIHGRFLGLTKEGYVQARIGLQTAAVISDLNAATTSANITNGGISTITSTAAQAITLDPPVAGADKTIVLTTTSTSTAARVVTASGATIQTTASSTYSTMTFNAMGQSVRLVGLSTARWAAMANNGVTLA